MHRLPAASNAPHPDPVAENEVPSWNDYEDTFLESNDAVETKLNRGRDFLESLSASTPCMTDSRTSSSIDTGIDWDDSWFRSVGNSDSCLASTTGSSCRTSPLNGVQNQGMSPGMDNSQRTFLYEFSENADPSVSSLNDALRTERDFMDFVMSSFPLSSPCSSPQTEAKKHHNDSSPKVGLDHLDNLCKLMEQLSDLKEANVKLKRRVQYLEDIRTLHEIHKEMSGQTKAVVLTPSEDENRIEPDNGIPRKSSSPEENSNSPPDDQQRRNGLYRSKTSGSIEVGPEMKRSLHKNRTTSAVTQERIRERSKSVGHPGSHCKGKKRSSRWSKVKEVLGIERLEDDNEDFQQCTCSDVLKTDHKTCMGTEGHEQKDFKACKGHSAKGGSELQTTQDKSQLRQRTGVLSSNSFSTFQHQALESNPDQDKFSESSTRRRSVAFKSGARKSETLDCPQTAQKVLEQLEKEEKLKKSPKSPWGRMKTMIQGRREIRHHKSESSDNSSRGVKEKKSILHCEDYHDNGNHGQRQSGRNSRELLQGIKREGLDDEELLSGCQETHPFNDYTWKENCQGVSISTSKRETRLQKNSNSHRSRSKDGQDVRDISHQQQTQREKPIDRHKSTSKSIMPPKDAGKRKKPKPKPLTLQEDAISTPNENMHTTEEERDTPKTPGSSPQLHRKWVWTKVKDVLKGKRDDGARLSISVPSSPSLSADVVAFNFQPAEGEALAEDSTTFPYAHPVSILSDEGYLEKGNQCVNTNTMNDLLRELQQNLSDDFNKKLEEWQKLRAEGCKIPSPLVERKDSFGKFRKISKPEKKVHVGEKMSKHNSYIQKKDISWLDKELQKVEREILRLSKEKQKFEKRAFRLKRLKEAMLDTHKKKEVLVRTSAGEFRFEGISDAFTKKLYEWETKKGVLPELSTIALLDECLRDKAPKISENHQRDCRSASDLCDMTSSSSKHSLSPEPTTKSSFQASRASSEPDLSTLSSQKEGTVQGRSKSGETLLTTITSCEISQNIPHGMGESTQWVTLSRETPQTEDNYYCLLEENMFLLDQLKNKEEFCRHLQKELDRLDRRSDKVDKNHEEEMEKYRKKLWEIHMSRPRDLQGSLQLIGELKTRIEELKKCSDKLKSDRDALEESFRYHNEQQAHLSEDLMEKVLELQQDRLSISLRRNGCHRKNKKVIKCDSLSISRVQELSTKLLQQAREMDQALMDRTRQICQLRWELLQRDMSAVLLQAALHRINWQGESPILLTAWDKKKAKLKDLKAWSIDTTIRCQSEESVAENWVQERLQQFSMTKKSEMPNIEFNTFNLISTVHELKKETLQMTTFHPDLFSDAQPEKENKGENKSAESEMADSDRCYDSGSAVNSRSSSFSSGQGCLRGSHSDTRLYERSKRYSNRRNSSSSMSCLSGMEASDSSSIHDSDRINFLIHRRPWQTWKYKENISSSCSSQSSITEEEIGNYHWNRSTNPDNDGAEEFPQKLPARYVCFKEDDTSIPNNSHSISEENNKCLITPQLLHLGFNTINSAASQIASVNGFDRTSPSYDSALVTVINSAANTLQGHEIPSSDCRSTATLSESFCSKNALECNKESSHTDDQFPMQHSESQQNCNSCGKNPLFGKTYLKDEAMSNIIDECSNHSHLGENKELLTSMYNVPEPLMNDECLRYSTIFYPSSQSPCNSDNDMNYSGIIPHTNTDASNTSSDHSEAEILNIVHPLQELMASSKHPNVQNEVKWPLECNDEMLVSGVKQKDLIPSIECTETYTKILTQKVESNSQNPKLQMLRSFSPDIDHQRICENKIKPCHALYQEVLASSGSRKEGCENDFESFSIACTHSPCDDMETEIYSHLEDNPRMPEGPKEEKNSVLYDIHSEMEFNSGLKQYSYLSRSHNSSAFVGKTANGNQNIKQIKYKGTKGFGKTPKISF